MEEPLIQTMRENLADDFQEAEMELFRSLFHWMQAIMISSAESS
jgi:hypothetical protein